MKRLLGLLLLIGALAAAALPPAGATDAPAQPGQWQITCADCPRWFEEVTEHTLRLDAAGRPHLAYGGDHLYYAYHDGIRWRYETADPASRVGAFAALDLDQAGWPHISYYDEGSQALKYAYRDPTGWQQETVDGGSQVAPLSSLAVDAAGHPHIAYQDEALSVTKYAHRNAAGWQIETVGAAESASRHCLSLALDSAGWAHVVFHGAGGLHYARRSSTGWQEQSLHTSYDRYYHGCTLALDGNDHPIVAYVDSYYETWLVRWTGASWEFTMIPSSGYSYGLETGLSLAVDGDGYLHLSSTAWYPGEPGWPQMRYAYQDAAGWHGEYFDYTYSYTTGQTSLALDGDGNAYFTFPGRPVELRLMRSTAGGWQQELVAESRDAGRLNALVIGSDDGPRIAYGNVPASVGFVEWTQGAGELLQRSVQAASALSVPDAASEAGATSPLWRGDQRVVYGVSLALDGDDEPHIAYAYSHPFWDLWDVHQVLYRFRDQSVWSGSTVVEHEGSGGYRSPSIAVDSGGGPRIGFEEYPYGIIFYARPHPSGWIGEIVDNDVRWFGGLALTDNDTSMFGYSTDYDLIRVAFFGASGWHYEIVEPVHGHYVAMALDSEGYPHLAYVTSNGDLRYARRTAQGWQLETATAGDLGEIDLAVDSSDRPHISFYDAASGSLMYANRDNAGWRSEFVAATGDRWAENAIGVDSQGTVTISFYDDANRDLLLAVRSPHPLTPTPTPTDTPTPLPKVGAAAYALPPPTIDGDLADWPAPPGVLVDIWNAVDYGGLISSATDASARCFHQWSAAHLYAACVVYDDVLVADDGDEWWKDDTVELVYDGLNDDQSYGADDHKYELRIDDGFSDYDGPVDPGMAAALRPWAGGYAVELAIPAARLGAIPMQAGRVIGLNIGLIDDDDGGDAEGWLGWSGNTWRHAELCGDLHLLPPDVTPTPTGTSKPTATATATRIMTPTNTLTPTPTATATPTATPSPTATVTPTGTPVVRYRYLPLIVKR